MQFGLTAFLTDETVAPHVLASAVEAVGFELLLFPDHTHIPVARTTPYPGGGELPPQYRRTYDPLVACAVAATATTTLRVGVGVCLVPARDPIVLAKQVASVDQVSQGRFVLGVGAGWNVEEIEDHGVAGADRWAVLRERVLAMREIWTEDEAEYHGDHVSFAPMWSWPKPYRRPHPPIIVGGYGPGVLSRVVEYGDEWLAMNVPGGPSIRQRMDELGELADAAGRPRPRVSVQVYGDPPSERTIERYVAAGVDRIDLSLPYTAAATLDTVAALGAVVARWQEA